MKTSSRGFTLIELLVVVAIIGMLSSVIIGSLGTARNKAKDAAIKAGVTQFAALLELQKNDTGSYATLQPTWLRTTAECNAAFGSSGYVTQARAICLKMISDTGPNGMYVSNTVSLVNNWSIMVYLPGRNTTYCAGSSGARSYTAAWGNWTGAGCYTTP